jgi:phosphate acyltransferase
MRIAVDAMGGDHAPGRIVDGALAAVRHQAIGVDLVGRSEAIRAEMARHPDADGLDVRIVDAPDVVEMAESPALALRRKPRASIRVAAELVARHEAVALVSAGHTGAAVVAAHAAFGMLAGVDRPALAPTIPTRGGSAVLIDAGATLECKPSYLLQFAVMGSVYARTWLGIARPRVGLLSIGEEETKGNDLTREAHQLLKGSPVNFVGNLEAREMFSGAADVIVCDGFTGNVALKLLEGTIRTVLDSLREEITASRRGKLGGLLIRPAARRLRTRFDPDTYGGAYLLGLRGLSVIAHGNSSRRAISSAIQLAARGVEHDVVGRLAARLPERTPQTTV